MNTPSAGELDCLVVLWQATQSGNEALSLSKILDLISEKRSLAGEPVPALTTVSTYLRSGVSKGLLEEVRLDRNGQVTRPPTGAARGALAKTRSPNTAYRAAVSASEAFCDTLAAVAASYPKEHRLWLLIDVANVLGIPKKVTNQLKAWVDKQRTAK